MKALKSTDTTHHRSLTIRKLTDIKTGHRYYIYILVAVSRTSSDKE